MVIVLAKDLMIVPSQVTKVRMTHIPSATALLGAVAGTAMLLVAQPLSILNPMTALTRATASLNPEAMTSPSSAATDGLICLAWVAVLALVLLRTVRRW